MKQKVVAPLDIQRKVPYADKFKSLADDISSSLRLALDAGDIGDIEAAGRQALAAMLTLYAEGQLPDKQAFAFLKSLAERKTPDPVQKVEQTTQVDMRILMGALITDNPDALQAALDRAEGARAEIAARLRRDAPLSLGTSTSEDGIALQFKEPDEIGNIRAGGNPTEGAIDDWQRFRNIS